MQGGVVVRLVRTRLEIDAVATDAGRCSADIESFLPVQSFLLLIVVLDAEFRKRSRPCVGATSSTRSKKDQHRRERVKAVRAQVDENLRNSSSLSLCPGSSPATWFGDSKAAP